MYPRKVPQLPLSGPRLIKVSRLKENAQLYIELQMKSTNRFKKKSSNISCQGLPLLRIILRKNKDAYEDITTVISVLLITEIGNNLVAHLQELKKI